MPDLRWFLPFAVALAAAQEAPFAPVEAPVWRPDWELLLRADALSDPGVPSDRYERAGAQLRLRWRGELGPLRWEAGTRSALGSDGNQFNAARWDQQPSNGTQLDLARGALGWVSERSFASLGLGFQETGLISSQAWWDPKLRFLGASALAGVRSLDGRLQEASLRGAAGRVRTILGGRIDLAAAQAVLKADTGPLAWTAHAARWELAWDAGIERLRRLPGQDPARRQRMTLDAGGMAVTWHGLLPLSLRVDRARNRRSGEDSEELQAAVGSRERVGWPQLAYTYQRLSSTGTLYPVNGDEWWFYRRARGPRLDASLPLPGRWVLTLTVLRQRFDGETHDVSRRTLGLLKRF